MKPQLLCSFFVIFLLQLFCCQLILGEVQIPQPIGDIYVQDPQHLLSSKTKKQIIKESKQLYQQTGAQVAILLVESLQGMDIRDYALKAFRTYKLGSKEKNNGLLLVIGVQDKKTRIEVGYGLEGIFPDSKVGNIIKTYTNPALRQHDIDKAAYDTIHELIRNISVQPQQKNITFTNFFSFETLIVCILIFAGILFFIFLKFRNSQKENNFDGEEFFLFYLIDIILALIPGFDDSDHGDGGDSGGGGADSDWGD